MSRSINGTFGSTQTADSKKYLLGGKDQQQGIVYWLHANQAADSTLRRSLAWKQTDLGLRDVEVCALFVRLKVVCDVLRLHLLQ